jgi:hypothetical protein
MTLRQPAFGHGGNARFDEEDDMTSRAIARLDDWLLRAEEVLAEQREAALSPSQAGVWGPAEEKATICLGDFERGLSTAPYGSTYRPSSAIASPLKNVMGAPPERRFDASINGCGRPWPVWSSYRSWSAG